jgi:hypothetical protein
MRLSFVAPQIVAIARQALRPSDDAWGQLFTPGFQAPPAPDGIPAESWPRIAEHVARAERVSVVVREQGLEASEQQFGDSTHAVEVATVIAAASQFGQVSFELLQSLLSCEVDELVAYGGFISLLLDLEEDRERVVRLYEQFCEAVTRTVSSEPDWNDRVASVRDGLASLYVSVNRLDDAHQIFEARHGEIDDLTAALAASRSFLARGHVARAMQWLELGAVRADEMDRPMMAFRLRKKRENLRKRVS